MTLFFVSFRSRKTFCEQLLDFPCICFSCVGFPSWAISWVKMTLAFSHTHMRTSMKVNNCVFLCTDCTCKCVQIAFFLLSRPAWSHTHTGLRQTALEKYDISNKFNGSALALIIYTFWWHFRREETNNGKGKIESAQKREQYICNKIEKSKNILFMVIWLHRRSMNCTENVDSVVNVGKAIAALLYWFGVYCVKKSLVFLIFCRRTIHIGSKIWAENGLLSKWCYPYDKK